MLPQIKTAHKLLLCALMFFPLLQVNAVSAIIGLLCILSIVTFIKRPDKRFHKNAFWLCTPILFVFVVFAFWGDATHAQGIIERRLSLLFIPLVFCSAFLNDDKKFFNKLIKYFYLPALALLAWGNGMILFGGLKIEPTAANNFSYLYRNSFEFYTGVHPTYVSLVVFVAALFKIHQLLFHSTNYQNKYLFFVDVFVCFLLIGGGILQASRMPGIAFMVTLLLQLGLAFRHGDNKKFAYILTGIVVVAVLAASPFIAQRFAEVNTQNMEGPTAQTLNSTNVRAGIWQCNFDLLKQHWLTGLGTGNVQAELNNCFQNYQTNIYGEMDYNTHNEYLNIWLTAGILGIGVFLFVLMRSFIEAIRSKNHLYLSFLVFICLCFFTENLLERQVGVVLFSLWQSIFSNKLA